MNDLVSIITPTYNSEKYIRETIKSVQNQTYPNWEMIIVDDCSTDATVRIIEEIAIQEPRITLIKSDRNSGAGIARGKSIEKAKGKYISFLDADDLWKSEKLQKQILFLKERNLPFTFSSYEWIDEDGNPLYKEMFSPNPLTYSQLKFCNYIGNVTGIYDVEFFGKIPMSSIRKRQDWIHWLTILKEINTAYPITESLAYYRVRKDSISSSKIKLVKYNYRVYRDFLNKNSFISFGYMIKFLFIHFFIKPKYTRVIRVQP
jgi:teichuronic acid biosynthesis glycosyltransferase TuaG